MNLYPSLKVRLIELESREIELSLLGPGIVTIEAMSFQKIDRSRLSRNRNR
jgi:hypothetical protein